MVISEHIYTVEGKWRKASDSFDMHICQAKYPCFSDTNAFGT